MDCFDFLYTSNKNYFPHMLTSIYSLISNNEMNFRIHIIEDGFTSIEYKFLNRLQFEYPNIEICIYHNSLLKKITDGINIPKWRDTDIANARLFFKELNPNVEKILYLDSDTVVVNSISNLFCLDLKKFIYAAKDPSIPDHIKNRNLVSNYYNSGVMLIDYRFTPLDYIKKIEDVVKMMNHDLIYPDQDIINIAFSSYIDSISIDYNVNPPIYQFVKYYKIASKIEEKYPDIYKDYYSLKEMKNMLETPKILHCLEYYNTRVWNKNFIHPFNKEYDFYRRIWDENYKLGNANYKLCNMPFFPVMNLLAKAYIPKEAHQKIKSIIKK